MRRRCVRGWRSGPERSPCRALGERVSCRFLSPEYRSTMNDPRRLRIATRRSPLALWQAEHIKAQLLARHPKLEVDLVPIETRGDKLLDVPLAKVGGKGLFVKELEAALYAGQADLAVHSMKDVPMALPDGLALPVICEREDPLDALVAPRHDRLAALPEGARVGTSSLRRQCQLRAKRPDLQIRHLRGNVQTRLAKLDAGEFDAIVLAAAGLKRMELTHRISERLLPESMLPAVGQGALGIECRADDLRLIDWLMELHHQPTAVRVQAERAMNRRLEGGCQVPIAGYAELLGERLHLRALVGAPDGSRMLEASATGDPEQADTLGQGVAESLLAQGAGEILAEVYGAGSG